MRIALTGGATGIGAEVAARLKAEGHEVTAFDVTAPPENVDRWVQTDLSDPASIAAGLDAARGPYDALINTANLAPRTGRAELVLAVNFIGFRMFLQGMLDKLTLGASIVNTASRAGAFWRENIAEVKALMALDSPRELAGFVAARGIDHMRAYSLSKEAVIVYTMAGTEALIAQNLRMNSVSPAAVGTGILGSFTAPTDTGAEGRAARTGRAGLPEEVAAVIVFLASPESRWLKGIDIAVDGGMGAMATSDRIGVAGLTGLPAG